MLQIKDFDGRTVNMSDDIYEITGHTTVDGYDKGVMVRMISGVDRSTRPGHHFNPNYVTVCRVDVPVAEFVGVLKLNLKCIGTKLPPVYLDPYGEAILIGSFVAFNYQGEVRKGVVKAIKEVTKRGRKTDYDGEPYICIHIDESESGDVSKVTNRMNLVVI